MTPTQLHSPTRIAVVAAASRWDLVVTGELDLASGQELVDVARVLASYRVPAAELDLEGVAFVDSAGLQAVDEALAVLAAAGTLTRVRRSGEAVERFRALFAGAVASTRATQR
ncbi:hypothetical protein GHK86_12265 [Acidimicrobiaceae bacterium USS-CC1]|uniref:STAS domain-containing protein n=1 Tax=Acidiferrimicrobium australe TaxID=2664430 RepID=A0ABW9QVV7_9ACTN|nr:hypothetical protein [Acidiferrimicrobium australe]